MESVWLGDKAAVEPVGSKDRTIENGVLPRTLNQDHTTITVNCQW
jgi:hypothetical protein